MTPPLPSELLSIELAGFPVAIAGLPLERSRVLSVAYGKWHTLAPTVFRLTVTMEASVPAADPPRGWWDGHALHLVDDGWRADLEPNAGRGHLTLSPAVGAHCFDAVLRNVTTLLVLNEAGLVFHAAAVDGPGGAAIFVGRSNTGKSTTCRRLAPGTIFSDEYVFLRHSGSGSFRLHPTPAWSHMQVGLVSRAPRPVAALYLIRKSPRQETRRLGLAEAVARLVQLPAFACSDLPWETSVLASLEGLLSRVPCWDLGLSLDEEPCLPHLALPEAVRETGEEP